MESGVGHARWRELIDALLAQKARLVAADDMYEMSSPNPGATEEQLLAAEERLGGPIPAQYREFLAVANGWDGWSMSDRLLSSEELKHGTINVTHGVQIRSAESDEFVDWEEGGDWIRITRDPDAYQCHLLLQRSGEGYRVGQVAGWPETERVFRDLEEMFVAEIASMDRFLEGQ